MLIGFAPFYSGKPATARSPYRIERIRVVTLSGDFGG
jgi:hypothetical protein